MIKPFIAALLILPLITGCDGSRRQVVTPGFGAALDYDLAIQVDNPERHPAEEVAPDLDGKVAADAWDVLPGAVGAVCETQADETMNIDANIRNRRMVSAPHVDRAAASGVAKRESLSTEWIRAQRRAADVVAENVQDVR